MNIFDFAICFATLSLIYCLVEFIKLWIDFTFKSQEAGYGLYQ